MYDISPPSYRYTVHFRVSSNNGSWVSTLMSPIEEELYRFIGLNSPYDLVPFSAVESALETAAHKTGDKDLLACLKAVRAFENIGSRIEVYTDKFNW